MATLITVCNLAMSHIGESPNISSIDPPEGSANAELCAQFLPLALEEILTHAVGWSFATKRVLLARLTGDTSSGMARYKLPTDYVKAIELRSNGSTYTSFVIEGTDLLTRVESPELAYVSSSTDLSKWPAKAVSALTRLLASYVAGARTKDVAITKLQLGMYDRLISEAATQDANDQKTAREMHHYQSDDAGPVDQNSGVYKPTWLANR